MIENLQRKIQLRKAMEQGRAPAPRPLSLEKRKGVQPPSIGTQGEASRIVSMPVEEGMSPDELEAFSRERVLTKAFDDGFRLFPEQANALRSYERYAGGLCPIGVGRGKTIASLMIANAAYQKGIERILLLIPPQVLGQLVGSNIREARSVVPIGYPIHNLGGKSSLARKGMSASKRKGLYIMPYSLLSTKDSMEVLRNISPGLVIADEAHQIANRSAARTRRLLSMVEEIRDDEGNGCECVFMSGTITTKSVMDYYHLMRLALNDYCPLPLTAAFATEWAMIIDSVRESSEWQDTDGTEQFVGPSSMRPLLQWARNQFPDDEIKESRIGYRKAYQHRLRTAPGVTTSSDTELGCSLLFENSPVEKYQQVEGWDALKEHIRKIEEEWVAPSGDEIDHKIHTWKWLSELTTGFYNELYWPTEQAYAARKQITESQAKDILQRAKEYHESRQEYAKILRPFLMEEAPAGLDTPMILGKWMSDHGKTSEIPEDLYEAWCATKALDFEGRPERDSRAVRVCPFKVNAAVEWATKVPKGKGAIVWVGHREIGRWMMDLLREAGLEPVNAGGGKHGSEAILDPKNTNRIIVASIRAHHEGKNLQHFEYQCMVQWPRPAKVAEQLLGRLHRYGQKADEVVVKTFNTLEFDHMVFGACLNDALYIHQTTGTRQKMVYGSYNPMPKVFPPAVLREAGATGVKNLAPEQIEMLREKFGYDA